MKKNRKRIDPRYFLEETAIRDDLDDSLAPLQEQTPDYTYRGGGITVRDLGSGGSRSETFRVGPGPPDECSTDPEDENYHPMCDLYKDPKSRQKYFKIFPRPLGRLDPGSEERVSTRAAMRGKKSKLKNVKLGTPAHTEPLRVREVVEDSDLGNPLERRPGVNPVMDRLRAGAAKTRGTGPYSSQPEPEAEEDLSIEDLAEDLSIEDLAEDIRDMIEGKINDIIDDAELHNYLMEVIELLREDTHTLGQE